MKALSWMLCVLAVASFSVGTLAGCEQKAEARVQVEKLPEVKASLPPVPTIPPPPKPIQYPDQSYSVFGLRRTKTRTIGTEVNLTAYIAKVFVPPECPPDTKCPLPSAPHIWLGDEKTETDPAKLLIVAGYAENQAAIDEAIKEAAKPKKKSAAPPEDTGLLPIPVDLFTGAKVTMKGRFSYMSGAGFQSSEGVLDYLGHTILEPGTPPEPVAPVKGAKGKKKKK
jgi:hypothetical protein